MQTGRTLLRIGLKGLETLGAASILLLFLWLALSSSLFLTVHRLEYLPERNLIVFQRTVRGSNIWLHWTVEAVEADGHECRASGLSHIQRRSEPIFVDIPPPLLSCVHGEEPVAITHRHQVYLFGWIPLRPLSPSFLTVTIP